MVAPRTRAERPAEIVPAARPARKASRRAAAEAAVDRSPPQATVDRSPPARSREPKRRRRERHAAKTAKEPSRSNGATAVAVPKAATEAPKRKKSPLEIQSDQLIKAVLEYDADADIQRLRKAIDFAIEAHGDQRRGSGEPFVTHPIASAQILAELDIDPVAIEAALLHDVPEDTEYALSDIEERFGSEVAQLVDGVTKLGKYSTVSLEQQQAENIRKMFLAMAEDIRVVLIKLADRLHNMRTLAGLAPEKQLRIARQTLEIYAPLAERLGIWQIKWELEDLAFKILEPARFRELAKLLDTRRKARESFIDRAIAELEPRLKAAGIEPDLNGRPKHIYSIWKKMQRKGAEFGEIYDVYAIRILVDEVRDCYAALGIVHSLWRPIPGQFDDYIAVPKNNLYQSLHTAVIAMDGKPLEIQIRTAGDAPDLRGGHRRALAVQGRLEGRARVRRQARLAPPAHGLAARRQRRDRVRRGRQARHLPGPGLRVHAEGRHQGPAGGRDAARLRVPDPHRRRPPDDRREGQQPPRPARLPAQERRHRRGRDDAGRPRSLARLAEPRPDLARPGEDPAMVQAPGARREHRPRPRGARPRAPAARPDLDGGGRARTGSSRSRGSSTTTRSTTSSRPSATARSSAQSVVMRLGVVGRHPRRAPDGRAAALTAAGRRRPGQGRRRPARALRAVLPPDPR